MTVRERIRFVSPGLLEDRITVNDAKALTKPWETVHTYRKAASPNDELREFACAEGLGTFSEIKRGLATNRHIREINTEIDFPYVLFVPFCG